MEADFTVRTDGRVHVQQRADGGPVTEFSSRNVLDAETTADTSIEVNFMLDEDGELTERTGRWAILAVRAYHIRDPETDRVYHTTIHADLFRQDVERIYEFLGFLLKTGAR
jgi:hypothetical protein